MAETIMQLQKKTQALKHAIKLVRSRQIQSNAIKNKIKSFVYEYFKDSRPILLSGGLIDENLTNTDSAMQDLLRCAQRNTLKVIYLRYFTKLSEYLNEIELKIISPISSGEKDLPNHQKYQQILETLGKIAPSAAKSYQQALLDLQDQNRISWRGTVVELRESLREVLDALAPDNEVVSQPNFKLEQNAKRPTMKQRAVFILKSRNASNKHLKTFESEVDVVEELCGGFIRSVYERSSEGTHTRISRNEALRIKDYITLALAEILELKT